MISRLSVSSSADFDLFFLTDDQYTQTGRHVFSIAHTIREFSLDLTNIDNSNPNKHAILIFIYLQYNQMPKMRGKAVIFRMFT